MVYRKSQSQPSLYRQLVAGRFGKSISSCAASRELVDRMVADSGSIAENAISSVVKVAFPRLVRDVRNARHLGDFQSDVEEALRHFGTIFSISSHSSDPVSYARFLLRSKRYSAPDLIDRGISLSSRIDVKRSPYKPKSLVLKGERDRLLDLVNQSNVSGAYNLLLSKAQSLGYLGRDGSLMAIASLSLLFGGTNKLSRIVDRNSLNLAVSIFSCNKYSDIKNCPKSFLQNPDPQRAEDLLLEFEIVFYSYHGRYHFARFDQHYKFAGASCFVLSAGEDLPDGSQGYCIATENGSIILMKSQQDLCIPSAVLEQHELTHHFDNVFNISTEDVSSEARAFTSELCFCSNLNCIEAYRDLTLNANGASAVDSNPYHRAARVDLLAHIKGRILHGLTLGIEVSVSDFQASIASFLDSQYKEHAGLTYGQIIEPFERMG